MPRMLRSRSRGASLPKNSARVLRLVHSGRWGRSDSGEGSALSHSPEKAILNPAALSSNTFDIEWPPRSGRRMLVPEVDRVAWFEPDEARRRLHPAQVAFVDRLEAALEAVIEAALDRS